MAIGDLIRVDENVYCLEHAQHMPGGVFFPTRMTVVRLKTGGLWLHSPVPVDDATAAKIEALGPVTHIVAPNHFHHMYVSPALGRWPKAKLWISPGLEQKRPELAERATPLESAPAAESQAAPNESSVEWRDEIDFAQIQGAPKMNELVFFHRASASLIAADLVFHWGPPRGARQWLLFTIMDVANGLRQSRAWNMITQDRKAAAASCETIFAWPLRRIVPCHGAIYENATPRILRDAVVRF